VRYDPENGKNSDSGQENLFKSKIDYEELKKLISLLEEKTWLTLSWRWRALKSSSAASRLLRLNRQQLYFPMS